MCHQQEWEGGVGAPKFHVTFGFPVPSLCPLGILLCRLGYLVGFWVFFQLFLQEKVKTCCILSFSTGKWILFKRNLKEMMIFFYSSGWK